MKIRATLLTCALFLVNANSSEIHPFLRGFLPADVNVSRVLDGGNSKTEYSTGFTGEVGAEFLAEKESSPFYFGGGIGFMNAQRKDKLKLTPSTIPIWGALSLRSTKSFKDIAPYGTLRAGWLLPATTILIYATNCRISVFSLVRSISSPLLSLPAARQTE